MKLGSSRLVSVIRLLLFGSVAPFFLPSSVVAQLSVEYLNKHTSLSAPVYGPEACDHSLYKAGNTAQGIPAGTQFYTGEFLSGSNYVAQFFGAAGVNQTNGLEAATGVTTFRTGNAAGFLAFAVGTFPHIPESTYIVTLQLRVWDNTSGRYPTWEEAVSGWGSGRIAAGSSPCFNATNRGSYFPLLPVGLRSFNLWWPASDSGMAIYAHPTNQVVPFGRSVTFVVGKAGHALPSYQWQFNGSPIEGATGSSYIIPQVQPTNAGVYSVMVTNVCYPPLYSSNATLTVLLPPVQSANLISNGLRIDLIGTPGCSYEIYASTNLNTWSSVGTATNNSGTTSFTDPLTGNFPQRFYRAQLLY